jgi:hypothetical protein
MKRELDDLSTVKLTGRDQRLRAPQPWKGKSHMALMIGGIVLLQVILFFALYLLLSRKHH